MAGKPAPPKRALIGVNRKPDQIERRRKELEQWLWRLVDDPHVARSKMLHSFLELSEAARLIHRCTSTSIFQGLDNIPSWWLVGRHSCSSVSKRMDASLRELGYTPVSARGCVCCHSRQDDEGDEGDRRQVSIGCLCTVYAKNPACVAARTRLHACF